MTSKKVPVSVAIIVATYNKPDYLRATLKQLARQTTLPDEIIIADDGSDERTARVIDDFRSEHPELKVHHSWHEDEGFNKCGALNKAITASSSDYILFLDDDCPCPAHFVDEHLRRAKPGSFTVGSSIRLGQGISEQVLEKGDIAFFLAFPSLRKLHHLEVDETTSTRKLILRVLLSGHFLGRVLDRLYLVPGVFRGGNSGAWRGDLVQINGFNEDLKWGHEDKEIGIRLKNLGLKLKQVRYSAANFHLYHGRPYADQKLRLEQNLHCRSVRKSGQFTCSNGLIKR